MGTQFIRVWTEKDVDEIKEHLLIVGEARGDCAKCRKLGIDYASAKTCPECGTTFKYITQRPIPGASSGFQWLKRIVSKRSDLTCIDFGDYKKIQDRLRAKDLLG